MPLRPGRGGRPARRFAATRRRCFPAREAPRPMRHIRICRGMRRLPCLDESSDSTLRGWVTGQGRPTDERPRADCDAFPLGTPETPRYGDFPGPGRARRRLRGDMRGLRQAHVGHERDTNQ
jgi:hypothetical protein